jgi:hypothetical protein
LLGIGQPPTVKANHETAPSQPLRHACNRDSPKRM